MKELMLIIPVLLWPIGLDISLPWLNKRKRRLVEEYDFFNQDIPLQELKANFWIVAPHGYLSSLRVPWEMGPEANCPLWYLYLYSTLTSPPFPLSLHLIFLFKYGYLILLSKFTCVVYKKSAARHYGPVLTRYSQQTFQAQLFFFFFLLITFLQYFNYLLYQLIRSLFH